MKKEYLEINCKSNVILWNKLEKYFELLNITNKTTPIKLKNLNIILWNNPHTFKEENTQIGINFMSNIPKIIFCDCNFIFVNYSLNNVIEKLILLEDESKEYEGKIDFLFVKDIWSGIEETYENFFNELYFNYNNPKYKLYYPNEININFTNFMYKKYIIDENSFPIFNFYLNVNLRKKVKLSNKTELIIENKSGKDIEEFVENFKNKVKI